MVLPRAMEPPMTEQTKIRRPRKTVRPPEKPIELQTEDMAHGVSVGVEVGADLASQPRPTAKPQSKAALILSMLRRAEGASLAQLVEATSWLPHTTRAALTGLKKKGHVVTSEKADDIRIYRVVAAPGAQQ